MPHVRIVMATYNGGAFLGEQIASFFAQDHGDWSLLVSDDGSTDATPVLVERAAADHPGRDIALVAGPRAGASAANFLAALGPEAPPLPEGAWVALSDQDDVWLPHRLSRAIARLQEAGGEGVYASRTWLCDAAGQGRRISRRHPRGPSFGNALVQNVLAGNTIVLSPAAARLARDTAAAARAASGGRGVAHHDWWLYALATGAGLRVILDDMPGLLYRQHQSNVMGAHRGLLRPFGRLAMLRDGRYGAWVTANVEALGAVEGHLTPQARVLRTLLADWLAGRGGRFSDLRRAGIARQTEAGNLLLATLARRGLLAARGGRGPGGGGPVSAFPGAPRG